MVTQPMLTILEAIKFEHSIFALPFAVMGMFMAAGGMPSLRIFLLVPAAMVTARSCAMGFNRVADARLDALNPRTAKWPVPEGRLGRGALGVFTVVMGGLFILCAWAINDICFRLSPVALAVITGYSLTKRFTSLTHFALGLALGIAPVGAWLAVTGSFAWPPCILSLAVICWTAGFDIIYACQDIEFDKRMGLHSLPVSLGVRRALAVSSVLHAAMVVTLLVLPLTIALGWLYLLGVVVVAGLLIYEHHIVAPEDLSRVNEAFFLVNGIVSLLLMALTVADTLLRTGA